VNQAYTEEWRENLMLHIYLLIR